MDERFVHPSKTPQSNDVKPEGNSMDERFVHPSKAPISNDVTPEGNSMDVRFVHLLYLLLVDYQYYTF